MNRWAIFSRPLDADCAKHLECAGSTALSSAATCRGFRRLRGYVAESASTGVPGAAAALGWRVAAGKSAVEPAHFKEEPLKWESLVDSTSLRQSGAAYEICEAGLVAQGIVARVNFE